MRDPFHSEPPCWARRCRTYWHCTCGFYTSKGYDAFLHRGRLVGVHVISPMTTKELRRKGIEPNEIHRKVTKLGAFSLTSRNSR